MGMGGSDVRCETSLLAPAQCVEMPLSQVSLPLRREAANTQSNQEGWCTPGVPAEWEGRPPPVP